MKLPIIIVGAGLVGMTQAIALASRNFNIILVDHAPLDQWGGPIYPVDERTTFVTWGSWVYLQSLGIEDGLDKSPVWDLTVAELNSPRTLTYSTRQRHNHPMGYIVNNSCLRQKLFHRLIQLGVQLVPLAQIKKVVYGPYNVEFEITLKDEKATPQYFLGQLLICAQGRNAPLRYGTRIRTKTWDFGEKALVTHLVHEKDHHQGAFEMFTPQGPLALLPMLPCQKTQKPRSGLVWCKEKTVDWEQVSDTQLCCELQSLFPYYGAFEVVGKRQVYPLTGLKVDHLVDHRFVLIGDAAHVLHPIAGQGVNLGWSDVKVLSDIITYHDDLGVDGGLEIYLRSYEKQRRHHQLLHGFTRGIVELFSSSNKALYYARNTGLAVVNRLGWVKDWIMNNAMGG